MCFAPNDKSCPTNIPISCAEQSTLPPPPPTFPTPPTTQPAVFGNCRKLCSGIRECAANPKQQSSYCKDWQNPAVCFGIYFRDASRRSLCFAPNDPTCKEDFPVGCFHKHHHHDHDRSTTFRSTLRSSTRRSSTTSTTSTTTTTTTTSTTTTKTTTTSTRKKTTSTKKRALAGLAAVLGPVGLSPFGEPVKFVDRSAHWIWNVPGAQTGAPVGQGITFASGLTVKEPTPIAVHVLIKGAATVILNGVPIGTAVEGSTSTAYTVINTNLLSGSNLLQISALNPSEGGAGLLVAVLRTSDNSVLAHTDGSWSWRIE